MIYGLTGYAESGKDLAARLIMKFRERHAYCRPLVRVAFGDLVRNEVCEVIRGIDSPGERVLVPDNIYAAFRNTTEADIWAKPTSPNARLILQWWGTDYRRNRDAGYWVRKWSTAVSIPTSKGQDVVTTDVRFENEAMAIKEWGGVTFRVERTGQILTTVHNHVSERPLPDHLIKGVIYNPGKNPDRYASIVLVEMLHSIGMTSREARLEEVKFLDWYHLEGHKYV